MVNDNSRKFKQNQMLFCIDPCIVELSIPIGVGEDRLRERGSLPATVFYQEMCIRDRFSILCGKYIILVS